MHPKSHALFEVHIFTSKMYFITIHSVYFKQSVTDILNQPQKIVKITVINRTFIDESTMILEICGNSVYNAI